MDTGQELQALERKAYLASYSDGIVDLFVGVSLLWIGVAWIWLPDLAGLAGVFPAVFISVMLAARKRLLESRLGYVKWSEPRRRWERRNLAAVLAAGVLIFLVGVIVFVLVSQESANNRGWGALVSGLPALLLAVIAMGLGFVMGTWRMLAYAGVLATAGVVTVLAELDPGWPLLAAGSVIAASGVVLVARFLRRTPAVASS